MEGKMNWLQHHLPDGMIVDAAWLEQRGYSGTLRRKYLNNGLLERLAFGVHRRMPAVLSNEEVSLRWQQVVISLQTLCQFPAVVGGRTALEVHGLAHYVAAEGPREIHLYIGKPIPDWVLKLEAGPRFCSHNSHRLFRTDSPQEAIAVLIAAGGKLTPLGSAAQEGLTSLA